MKLSVAMCTFNGAMFVEQQLTSILRQGLPVDEIVVCDDSSTDNTLDIVKQVAQANQGVKWIIQQNQPNLGVTKNFEKAINLCTGDIIFLSDQDDLWKPEKTKYIVDYFETHKTIDVVFTDADIIDGKGNLVTAHSLLDSVDLLANIELWNNGADLEFLNIDNRATGATMAFRRTCVDEFLPFITEEWSDLHDGQLAWCACLKGSLGVITERLICYRQHGSNAVGIKKENWIFNNDTNIPAIISALVEPRKLKSCKTDCFKSTHLNFYRKRLLNYGSIKGKCKLILSIPSYRRVYHKYWHYFFLSDLLYGVNNALRLKILNSKLG